MYLLPLLTYTHMRDLVFSFFQLNYITWTLLSSAYILWGLQKNLLQALSARANTPNAYLMLNLRPLAPSNAFVEPHHKISSLVWYGTSVLRLTFVINSHAHNYNEQNNRKNIRFFAIFAKGDQVSQLYIRRLIIVTCRKTK